MDIYKIYTKKIALQLRKKGFPIIRTEINENFPQFDVYIFPDSEKLRKELSKVSKQ